MFKFYKSYFFLRDDLDLNNAIFFVKANSPTGKPTIHLFTRLRFQPIPECIKISYPENDFGIFVDFRKNFFSRVLYILFCLIRCISRHVFDAKCLSLTFRTDLCLLLLYKWDNIY